ncbi:hypothetical protein PGT21_009576 [Puccinia graminis f. sp. tritici]|uniref:Uncharacterized protein n=1 Tax=Puccinia graminis f. sp. tritici TaxID=56615 RepID=A0A5B0QT35_PUCGR|nr:hypothetical protein PGT21_009576 [Puccinia graminis f. sp. tritici]
MVCWKTVTLILVVCLTAENGLCVPASIKDFPSEGKEVVQSDIEGLNNPIPLELSQTNGEHHAHQAASDISRGANRECTLTPQSVPDSCPSESGRQRKKD